VLRERQPKGAFSCFLLCVRACVCVLRDALSTVSSRAQPLNKAKTVTKIYVFLFNGTSMIMSFYLMELL